MIKKKICKYIEKKYNFDKSYTFGPSETKDTNFLLD